jgi:hypothetical protein
MGMQKQDDRITRCFSLMTTKVMTRCIMCRKCAHTDSVHCKSEQFVYRQEVKEDDKY